MAYIIWFIIAVLVFALIYNAINKRVSKAFALKDTGINTDLVEFRESHATTAVISSGSFNARESITQMYERMCVIDPVRYMNDPSIGLVIKSYRSIISGKTPDPDGLNVPSEILLGLRNPDYQTYMASQARALKGPALKEENKRVKHAVMSETMRAQFMASLAENDIPARVIAGAVSDGKINTYTAEDWKTFCRVVKNYLDISDAFVVGAFVETFNDKEIVFDTRKFEIFSIFYKHDVPIETIKEIVKGRITVEQALSIYELVIEDGYEWNEAMSEVLTEDLQTAEAADLRTKYGYRG